MSDEVFSGHPPRDLRGDPCRELLGGSFAPRIPPEGFYPGYSYPTNWIKAPPTPTTPSDIYQDAEENTSDS